MWTTLALTALVASAITADVTTPLTPGTEVRLTAGPAVHVPGVFSGTDRSYTFRGQFVRRDGLLVFVRDDGAPEAVIAPGATVQGTLIGADTDYVYLRRKASASERIHRAWIARVQALDDSGRGAEKGAFVGAAVGAGLGIALYALTTGAGSDSPPSLGGVVALAAMGGGAGLGVGAAMGALSPGSHWREVPLAALPGGATPAAAAASIEGRDSDVKPASMGGAECRGANAADRLLTVPPRPLRRAVEALGSERLSAGARSSGSPGRAGAAPGPDGGAR